MAATVRTQSGGDDIARRYDALYEQYGQPLERDHHGEYIAISPAGETILGSSPLEVAQEAKERFGQAAFVYQVGARSIGKWR